MKKTGLLNLPISHTIASLGHMDTLTIADAGLPIPATTKRIDLAVKAGLPGFLDVLAAVLMEMKVQEAIIATEMKSNSPQMYKKLIEALGDTPVRSIPHEDLKTQTETTKAIVRTGEFTPYANVMLVSGVLF